MAYTVEYLVPERVDVLWPVLGPMVDRFIETAADGDYTTDVVHNDLKWKKAFGFVESFNGVPTFLVVFNIRRYSAFKAAGVLVLVGTDFKGVRDRIWPLILRWMYDNKITTIEGAVSDAMYRVCKKMFGFEKVCNQIRLELGESK